MIDEFEMIGVLIFFPSLIWIIREILFIAINRKKRKDAEHLIRVERTREYYARLRTRLLNLVIIGQIHPDSIIFQFLYKSYTTVLRRPEQYIEISKELLLLSVVFHNKNHSVSKNDETTITHKEIKELLHDTSEGIMMLIVEYSPLLRFLYSVSNKLGSQSYFEFLVPIIENVQKKIIQKQEKSNKTLKDLKTAQIKLAALAAA